MVYFFPGKTDASHIRVGRRRLPVDWVATAKLRPGRHTLSWRKGDTDAWHPAGTISLRALPADQYYEVRLKGTNPSVAAKMRKGGRAP